MLNNNNKPKDQSDCELRNIMLTNENSDLRMQLDVRKRQEYDKVKQLEAQLESLRQANARMTEELCEWHCINCSADYYGPSAVEKGAFKCISATCKGMYCVPKKYLGNGNETDMIELLKELSTTTKKAA